MSTANDNNLLKIEVLKKGLLEQRKKTGELEKEVIQLKEEVIVKQETIDKLKEELSNLRDKSSKKKIQRFITGFFDEGEQSKIDDDETAILKKENEDLKEKIQSLQSEKNFINSKLSESMTEYNSLKAKLDSKVEEAKKEMDNKVAKIKEDFELKNQNLLKQIFDKNQMLAEQSKSIKCMSELYKSFDMVKFNYEKEISTLKAELEQSTKNLEIKQSQVDILLKEQEKLLKQIEEGNNEIMQMKDEIKQYKLIIDDLTPINTDYVFQGYLITKGVKTNLEISFGKYKQSISFQEENQKEKVFVNKDISDVVIDKKNSNRVWICIYSKGKQNNYLCEFTKKEAEYIVKFYQGIKVRQNDVGVENALMNASLGDYFY